MRKTIKILFLIINIILVFSVNSFAKYNYRYTLNVYKFSRDTSEITYNISRTGNDTEYTNQDVLLTINLNKEIEDVNGFTMSEDRKTLTKLLKENESNKIIVEDLSGNKKEIFYDINNIDKMAPEIVGVEDGKIYNSNVEISYTDNVGIKDVKVDKYSNLKLNVYDDYYDTSFFKGTDLTDTTAKVRIGGHPKNTKEYKYYINNELKAQTEEGEYKFSGLLKGTNYKIKVEAIDAEGNVLETATRNIKTKMYTEMIANKKSNGQFEVTLKGVDSSIDNVVAVGYTNLNNQIATYPSIKSDRSVNVTFSAQSVTGSLQNGYYYFHLQLYDNQKGGVVDTACCNIKFNETYVESTLEPIDIYNLKDNGNYQISVIDLAGNITQKTISISK